MINNNTFTLEFDKNTIPMVKDVLLANGWQEEPISDYVLFRLRSPMGSIALMYSSGKLVFQGKEDFTSVISNIKELQTEVFDEDFESHFGVDEVGKGDYFGPLVVVGCFVTEEFFRKIKLLGFADSKKFSDKKISKLFTSVKDYPYYYSSIVNPKEYNGLVKEYNNVSILLAKQHALVIEEGLKDLSKRDIECNYVVVDQFSSSKSRVINELGQLGKNCKLIQHHKGESDIVVACASIIARGIFIEKWEEMNMKYGFEFPKGASNVVQKGKEFVSLYGQEKLNDVAKIGFKTTNQILSFF
jgi:ribonuclease HIII